MIDDRFGWFRCLVLDLLTKGTAYLHQDARSCRSRTTLLVLSTHPVSFYGSPRSIIVSVVCMSGSRSCLGGLVLVVVVDAVVPAVPVVNSLVIPSFLRTQINLQYIHCRVIYI